MFSSPSGDGLVLTNNGYINRNLIFSSPSGGGLVLFSVCTKTSRCIIFVPAWGWVGSVDNSNGFGDGTLFSSPLGVGLVLDMDGTLANFYRFSSPLGDGLVRKK